MPATFRATIIAGNQMADLRCVAQSQPCIVLVIGRFSRQLWRFGWPSEQGGYLSDGLTVFLAIFGTRRGTYGMRLVQGLELPEPTTLIP
jgi:hypothetical protein